MLSGKVQANLQDGASGGVIQHAADGIEDGHEVMYQTPEARAEARCFLRSLAQGARGRRRPLPVAVNSLSAAS